MPLFTINVSPDVKGLRKALERIANVLERIAIHSGVPLEDAPIPDEKDTSQVSYTSDKHEVRRELAKELGIDDLDDKPEEAA